MDQVCWMQIIDPVGDLVKDEVLLQGLKDAVPDSSRQIILHEL